MARLTIIMPTYNGERFLRLQIDSILAQTDPDFELVVIDDGSTDTTNAIVDDYVARDTRVRRLPSHGNIGQRLRLRQLIEATDSEFFAVADQDDVWHPARNERLFAAIGAYAIAFGRSQLIDGDGTDLGRSVLESLNIDARRAGPLRTLFNPLVSAHAAIVRRSWFDIAVLAGHGAFDWYMGLEAMLSLGLVYVDEAVVYHRIHGGNQMNGPLLNTQAKRVSLYRLRKVTSFVGSGRVYLFQAFDQLSRSAAISAECRKAFEQGANACRYAWFQPLKFGPGKNTALRVQLHQLFDRFASSAEDLAFFIQRIDLITRSQWSPANIRSALARYVDDRPDRCSYGRTGRQYDPQAIVPDVPQSPAPASIVRKHHHLASAKSRLVL